MSWEKNERGAQGEEYTARQMAIQGYQILERNYHCPYGEVDLIACTERYLVFVEVKTRSSFLRGTPEEAVTPEKQRKLVRTALMYLQEHPTDLQPRFDVAAVRMDRFGEILGFRYYANAFEGEGVLF